MRRSLRRSVSKLRSPRVSLPKTAILTAVESSRVYPARRKKDETKTMASTETSGEQLMPLKRGSSKSSNVHRGCHPGRAASRLVKVSLVKDSVRIARV